MLDIISGTGDIAVNETLRPLFLWTLCSLKRLGTYLMYMGDLLTSLSMHLAHGVTKKALETVDWSYIQLSVTMWVLGN